MDQLTIYLKMGFDHISDWRGIDHIIFILVLCAVYTIQDCRKVAVLITAFTIGHSLTLALAAFKIFIANPLLIELLIPVTIFLTSLQNIYFRSLNTKENYLHYLFALLFGFIHGMGFSNFFNAMMSDSMSIALPLFAFNLGLELGQLCIVFLFFGFYFLIKKLFNPDHWHWTLFISGAGAGMAILMFIERLAAN